MLKCLSRLSALGAALLTAGVAHAGPTSLYLMPIADCLKQFEGFAYTGLQGVEHNVSKSYSYYNAVTIGLGHHVEVGYDSDYMGHISGNVKVQLLENAKGALSAGVSNWYGDSVDPYVVGRLDGKGYRLHAGFWRTMGTGRFMAGADFPIMRDLTGAAEFLSGPSSQSWGSIYYAVPKVPGLSLGLALGVPSNHREGLMHSALLFYSFKL